MQSLPMQSRATEGFLTGLPEPVRRSLRGAASKGSSRGSSWPGLLSDIDLPGGRGEVGGPDGGTGSAFAGSAGCALWTVDRCGPEPISPEGIEGRTCVMIDGRAAWASQLLPRYDG